MNSKLKKTIFFSIVVSISANIRFDVIADGFIVALSVLFMAIFIYCYEDLTPKYIAFCSGICSPSLRFIILMAQGESWKQAAVFSSPDVAFFFAFGIIYTLVYKYIIREEKSIRNFPYVLLICDFSSNMIELSVRSVIIGDFLIGWKVMFCLAVIAFVRTALIQLILIAIEAYSNLLVREEHDKVYKRLIVQASIFESELYLMKKNVDEIENVMRRAFQLYKTMETRENVKDLCAISLDISRNAHEVKGDYLGVIESLESTFVDDYKQSEISISDIIHIEKNNLVSGQQKKTPNVSVRVKENFYVKEYFKMMSIVRNLMVNAIEASDKENCRINVVVDRRDDNYVLRVKDTGKGIRKENIENLFYYGFSTKFNESTGNVQRGIGLNLVKEYVEKYFNGTIEVDSVEGEYTEFVITMPMNCFRSDSDDSNEVLHS